MTVKLPLILLPGMPLDAALWAHQVRHLGEVAEPRVISTFGADNLKDLATQVLDSVAGPFLLAGLSLGGYVAMEVMRLAPDRVTKLALIATNARADTPESAAGRHQSMNTARTKGLGPILDASVPRLLAPSRRDDAALVAEVRAMGERVGVAGYLRQQAAILGRPDSRESLKRVRCPTLVIGGRDDAGSPPALHAEMADAIPGARLAIIEDCGHLSPLERPHAVTALLRDWVLYR